MSDQTRTTSLQQQDVKTPPLASRFTPSPASPFFPASQWLSQPVAASFVAGGLAGAVSRTVVSPLERLKILYQIQTVGRTDYQMSIGKALGRIWKTEGFAGFMKGNGSNCLRIVPYSAVQFSSYNLYKRFFEDTPGAALGPLKRLTCGAMAGITSVTCTYPLDIVRTRLSIQSATFDGLAADRQRDKLPGMMATLKNMYKTEGGLSALYRGIVPTVAGVAPYVSQCRKRKCHPLTYLVMQVGLNFMVYESVRTYFTPVGEKNPSAFGKLGAGAISGAVAQTCTYPL